MHHFQIPQGIPPTQKCKRAYVLVFPHPSDPLPLPRPDLRERNMVPAAISVTLQA